MAQGGSKYFKLKINTETGEIVKKVDENNNPAKELTPQELQQIYQTKAPEHIGEILYTHSSSGCIIVVIRGIAFMFCNLPTYP